MLLLAEASWQVILSNVLAVAALAIPGIVYFAMKLAKLDAKLSNGLCKQVELLRNELSSQRQEHGKRIHDLEISDAKREGGKSDIHGGG